jgi:UDP-GlcNAc:undecaprenyl-phosphate GlcNAc-1-phosphate transferase
VSIRHYLLVIAVAAVATLLATPVVRKLGIRWGVVATPGGRNVHEGLVPRIGGVAIYLGMLAAVVLQAVGEQRWDWGGQLASGMSGGTNLYGVLVGMTVVFGVGLVDDIYTLRPVWKLVGQIAAAAVVVASGLHIEFMGNPVSGGLVALGLFSIPVTLVYIVGFTNVINLIDGLDGLAAGVSAIAGTMLLVLAAQTNRLDAAALAAALIGACIGFLRFNFNPASIFMGDSGALFLGFTLSVISLLGVMKTTAAIALAVPLLIVGVPIFDTASAIVRRVRHNRPIGEADKGHIHHRLLGRGFDQRQTVLIIYVWCAALAVGAYAVRYAPGPVKLFAVLALFGVSAGMAYWLGLFESAHHAPDERSAKN